MLAAKTRPLGELILTAGGVELAADCEIIFLLLALGSELGRKGNRERQGNAPQL